MKLLIGTPPLFGKGKNNYQIAHAVEHCVGRKDISIENFFARDMHTEASFYDTYSIYEINDTFWLSRQEVLDRIAAPFPKEIREKETKALKDERSEKDTFRSYITKQLEPATWSHPTYKQALAYQETYYRPEFCYAVDDDDKTLHLPSQSLIFPHTNKKHGTAGHAYRFAQGYPGSRQEFLDFFFWFHYLIEYNRYIQRYVGSVYHYRKPEFSLIGSWVVLVFDKQTPTDIDPQFLEHFRTYRREHFLSDFGPERRFVHMLLIGQKVDDKELEAYIKNNARTEHCPWKLPEN